MGCSLEKKLKTDLLEKLADLEHRQWAILIIHLCKEGYMTKRPEVLGYLNLARKPYTDLSEEDKEKDRRFARCVTQLLREELGVVAQKIRDRIEVSTALGKSLQGVAQYDDKCLEILKWVLGLLVEESKEKEQ